MLEIFTADGGLIIGLLAASTVVQTAGAIQQGRAAAAQARAEEDILKFNAQQKLKEAREQRRYAESEAEKFAERGRRLISAQRIGFAKGGVLMEGTPAYVLEETAQNLEADRLEILRQGFLQSEFTVSEAAGMKFAAKAAGERAKNIKRGTLLTAGGTLLRGAALTGYAGTQMET